MEMISNILPTVQIVISFLLIISILLQQTGAGIGAGLGGSSETSASMSTRRGFEKTLLKVTIFLAILFFVTSVLALLIK
jgi:protein translocase SecG subunit